MNNSCVCRSRYGFDDDIVTAIAPETARETVVQPCAYALLYRQRRPGV
jgi:hypothetical protein